MSGSQGNHLWEFIRDLLLDSRYNPSIIKWEDRDDGTFKFVKSDQVAKLWGRKKNNHAMTYEKLSRAMRCVHVSVSYSYKLPRVPITILSC